MKKLLTLTLLLILNEAMYAQNTIDKATNTATTTGIGLGTSIAVVASWSRNQSVRWAIFHGILGWFYVIYFVLSR
jgi:hypothetical protein